MQRFIAKANIARFRELLAATSDPVQRESLRALLAVEEEKLRALEQEAPAQPEEQRRSRREDRQPGI